jgi:hypothetical protein
MQAERFLEWGPLSPRVMTSCAHGKQAGRPAWANGRVASAFKFGKRLPNLSCYHHLVSLKLPTVELRLPQRGARAGKKAEVEAIGLVGNQIEWFIAMNHSGMLLRRSQQLPDPRLDVALRPQHRTLQFRAACSLGNSFLVTKGTARASVSRHSPDHPQN